MSEKNVQSLPQESEDLQTKFNAVVAENKLLWASQCLIVAMMAVSFLMTWNVCSQLEMVDGVKKAIKSKNGATLMSGPNSVPAPQGFFH